MTTNYISYLPVDNGDTILLKVKGKTVLTDLHYRKSDEVYDIKSDIEDACSNDKLDFFVLTHTDKDHLRGFDEIFYCGEPADWDKSKGILVKTIVCSQYAIDLTNPSDVAKPLIDEIRRRNRSDKKADGNKLQIVGDGDEISVDTELTGYVLSPSEIELENADPKADKDTEANNTSVVVRWDHKGSNTVTNKILLGGDAEHEVWARLNKEKKDVKWNVITAPHHCSYTALGSKEEEDGDYVDDDDAIACFENKDGYGGFVVASCKKIKNDKDNPPHYDARSRWIEILRDDEDDTPSDRFYCTAGEGNKKEAPVKFELTSTGISEIQKKTDKKALVSTGLKQTTKYG